MNPLSYYNRQKEGWSDAEIEQIKNEYQTQNMNIMQIGDLHRRTPGSISYRLKNMKIIEFNTEARGYPEYKESSLYKEIVNTGKNFEKKKEQKSDESKKIHVTQTLKTNEYIELKKDINSLHKKMDELIRLMNAVYTFETCEE